MTGFGGRKVYQRLDFQIRPQTLVNKFCMDPILVSTSVSTVCADGPYFIYGYGHRRECECRHPGFRTPLMIE